MASSHGDITIVTSYQCPDKKIYAQDLNQIAQRTLARSKLYSTLDVQFFGSAVTMDGLQKSPA